MKRSGSRLQDGPALVCLKILNTMTGIIEIINGKVEVRLIDCVGKASFKWYYQRSRNHNLQRIGNSTNIIGWVGYGIYICEVVCDNAQLRLSREFEIVTEKPVIINQLEYKPEKHFRSQWDYTKIPENVIPEIKELLAKKSEKQLALMHNQLELSDHKYCCGDLSIVIDNFQKYIDGLPGS